MLLCAASAVLRDLLGRIVGIARQKRLLVKEAGKGKLDELSGGENHQGVVAITQAYEYVDVADILAKARDKGEAPFLVLLESIQDPHNLGAILRTADACACMASLYQNGMQ